MFHSKITALLLGALLLCLPAARLASASPIRIEADRMESNQQQNQVLFHGNVEARQDDMAIQADSMTVTYGGDASTAGPAGQKVDRIVAQGNVKIVRSDWVATSNEMEFFAADRRVVLSGEAKAWQGKNMVTGNRIELYLDEGRSVVESGGQQSGRVQAFLYPDEEGDKEEKAEETPQPEEPAALEPAAEPAAPPAAAPAGN